ncbi:MAG TPA: hypothetical protein VKU19_23555 [Bryobacteraceae bacterium]|nr:hypothetical protein [Bryobacteraceae bacterium]
MAARCALWIGIAFGRPGEIFRQTGSALEAALRKGVVGSRSEAGRFSQDVLARLIQLKSV